MGRLLDASLTGLPIAIMSVASCASYAHLLAQGGVLGVGILAAAHYLSSGLGVILQNRASHCPYFLASPDMTISIYLHFIITYVAKANIPEDAKQTTTMLAVHLGSATLGAFFCLLGKIRLAVALNYLPFSVVAGFISNIGVAIIKSTITMLWPTQGESYLPLACGITFALSTPVLKKFGVPSHIATVGGTLFCLLTFWGWAFCTGRFMEDLRGEGWLAVSVPYTSPTKIFEFVLDWEAVDLRTLLNVLCDPGALSLLLVACISRALAVASVESSIADAPYSVDDEMSWTGLATLGGGLFGGMPINPSSGLTALVKSSAKGDEETARYTSLIVGALQIAVWASGFPLINYIPQFILSGLLMSVGIGILQDWAWTVRMKIQWTGIAVIYGMMIVSLWSGLILGVALGIVLAMALTSVRFSQLEVLKYHVSGVHFRSQEVYSSEHRGILRTMGDTTQVVGVTSFLFEGLAITLAKYIKEVLRTAPHLKTLVLDFFSCQGINDAACAHLIRVAQQCHDSSVQLVLVNLSRTDMELLQAWDIESQGCAFADSVMCALRDAEIHILQENKMEPAPPAPQTRDSQAEKTRLANWLGEDAANELLSVTSFKTFQQGLTFGKQGEVSTSIFVAVPGHSDVQFEVSTGKKNPQVFLRTTFGAVCPAEALSGTQCRGTWRAMSESVGLFLGDAQLSKLSVALAPLLTAGMTQQSYIWDQLSALHTLSKGGGWQGVTFDATTKAGAAAQVQRKRKASCDAANDFGRSDSIRPIRSFKRGTASLGERVSGFREKLRQSIFGDIDDFDDSQTPVERKAKVVSAILMPLLSPKQESRRRWQRPMRPPSTPSTASPGDDDDEEDEEANLELNRMTASARPPASLFGQPAGKVQASSAMAPMPSLNELFAGT